MLANETCKFSFCTITCYLKNSWCSNIIGKAKLPMKIKYEYFMNSFFLNFTYYLDIHRPCYDFQFFDKNFISLVHHKI